MSTRRSFHTSTSVTATMPMSRRSRRFPSQSMEERRKGPFRPRPVVGATNVHQVSDRRHSILLRQHPEDGETVRLVVHEQNADCPGNISHQSSVTSSTLLGSPPLVRLGQELVFAAYSLVEGLHGDAGISGDVLQTHLFVRSRSEMVPRCRQQAFAGCRGRVGSRGHSVGALVGFIRRQFFARPLDTLGWIYLK